MPQILKSFFSLIVLMPFFTGLAAAGEPAQLLMRELMQPQLVDGTSREASRQELPAGMFTLEELRGGSSATLNELELPEDESVADIPLMLNDRVAHFISYFQTKGRSTFARWLARSTRYLPMMKEILRKEGLPDELVYVAMIESGFHLHARSHANAVGPWQFMSATGRRYSLRIDEWVDERKDPVKATMAAALYLKDLYGMFNNDWYLAAAGYNAGENKIFRAISKYDTSDFWELTKGAYLKRETKEYVPKLLAAAIIARDPSRYGFTEIIEVPVVEYDTVAVEGRTDLELVARLTGTTYQTVKELNPALRHWCTPPNYPGFELRVPKGTGLRLEQGLAAIPQDQRYSEKVLYHRYTAGKRDTLKGIARRFGISAGELAELNGLNRKQRIAGRSLVVPARLRVDFAREGSRHEQPSPSQAASASLAAAPAQKYYTVRKGDTLQLLARRFKVPAAMLAAWNNLKETVALVPGKRLIVAKTDRPGRDRDQA